MDTTIAIQVLPVTASQEDLLRVVDAVIAYIQSTGLHYVVGPLETTVEGSYDQLIEIIKNAQLICAKEGAQSVKSYVKIFYNPKGDLLTIDEKIGKYQ